MSTRNRSSEEPRTWFRCERFYRANEHWYFHTREGISVGPYRARFEAEVDAGLLISLLKNTPPEDAHRVIRNFLIGSGGELDIVNDPAFTSYLTNEGSGALLREAV
ncbi:MAG: DUF6316 family protein [Pseudomonadales bacterium]